MSKEVNTSLLSTMVKRKRGQLGLRVVATEIGDISASTLSRIEQGKVPDLGSFIKICRWLKVEPEMFTSNSSRKREISTKDEIAIHLRADQALSSDTADALVKMIELAYESEENSRRKK